MLSPPNSTSNILRKSPNTSAPKCVQSHPYWVHTFAQGSSHQENLRDKMFLKSFNVSIEAILFAFFLRIFNHSTSPGFPFILIYNL